MFHLAPPLWAGSGVRIESPGCVRSFQSLMFLGFPGRTSKTTTELETIPPSGAWVQSRVIRPAFLIVSTSGASDRATTSAGNPLTTF